MSPPPSPEGKPAPEVLVIGLDGATFNLLEPMVEAGRLPTIGRLINEGASAVLRSTIPPVTIPAWVSMLTGKNPGKLGVYDLLRRVGYRAEPNSLCFEGNAPVWRILNKYGVSTGLLNIPGTYPPEEVDGFMVTGMLTPSKKSDYSYPTDLAEKLEHRISEYEIDVLQWQYFDEGAFIKDVHKVTEKREKAAAYLAEAIPCDFLMVVFTSGDRLQHVLWKKTSVIEDYWEQLDHVLGDFLKNFGEETTVILVSDHGFGPIRKTFYVNEWLRDRGLLRIKGLRDDGIITRLGRGVEWFYRTLGKALGKLPFVTSVIRFMNDIIGFERIRKYAYEYISAEHLEGRVAWRKTQAFSGVHSPHFGQVYINVKKRMPRGSVKPEEREFFRDAIIRDLRELRDPETGEPLRVEAYASEELYMGERLDEAPDIIFLVEGGTIEVDAMVGEGKVFAEGAPFTGWTGTHTRDGVFIARGPSVVRGRRLGEADILDVAPTILHLFGVPVPKDVDGRPLDEIFDKTSDFGEREEVTMPSGVEAASRGLSDEEKALIEARLRRLGYIS